MVALFAPTGRPEAEEIVSVPLDPTAVAVDHLAALQARVEAGENTPELVAELDGVVAELTARVRTGAAPEAEPVLLRAFELRVRVLQGRGELPSGYRGEFIAAVAPGAMFADVTADVPASVTIAQAIIESGWGKSAPGYNLFGMKGEGPAGSERRRVVEYRHGRRGVRKDAFRAYHSFTESLEDHARVLSTSARYAAAREVAEDPAAYAAALQGRYATDPKYATKLMDLSDRYVLGRFDQAPPPALADETP